MNEQAVRVWAEEVDPPSLLRMTWRMQSATAVKGAYGAEIVEALRSGVGVLSVVEEDSEDALLVTIDAEMTSRYRLAEIIRQTILRASGEPLEIDVGIRVWAEHLDEDRMRITWTQEAGSEPDTNEISQRRRVAAWIGVLPAVISSTPDPDGVLVRYDPLNLNRSMVRDIVIKSISDNDSLRSRTDDLMRRSPTYANLARKLALDSRTSPIPSAAKQAASSSGTQGFAGSKMRSTALRFIPGATTVTRIHMMLPMLRELSSWSRNTDPAVVDEHLRAVGLSRGQLQRDTVTATEIQFYARDYAGETTKQIADRASIGAKMAYSMGQNALTSIRAAMSSEDDPDRTDQNSRSSTDAVDRE